LETSRELLIYKLIEYERKFKAFKGYFVLAQQSFKGFNQRKLTEDINKIESGSIAKSGKYTQRSNLVRIKVVLQYVM